MKILISVCSLGLAIFTCGIAWEKMTADSQCMDSALAVLQTGNLDGTKATKAVETGCARLARDGEVAEKVLNKLP